MKLRLWVTSDALKRSDQTIRPLWTPSATKAFQYCRGAHFRPLLSLHSHSNTQISHGYFSQPRQCSRTEEAFFIPLPCVSSQDNCITSAIKGTSRGLWQDELSACSCVKQPIRSHLSEWTIHRWVMHS